MSFQAGSLVRARGREWVVLPQEEKDLLLLRPLGGTDADVCGIYLPLEQELLARLGLETEAVEPASFAPPDPEQAGDHTACALLRDAVRLGFRAGAGPFRSLGRIAVEPRPYQLVPLLMALKLSPVRLLIADDVGIGKTAARSPASASFARRTYASSGRRSWPRSSTSRRRSFARAPSRAWSAICPWIAPSSTSIRS
jgi:hypothetical protein